MTIRKATSADVPTLVALSRGIQEMHADAFPGRFRRDAPADVVQHAFSAAIDAPSPYWLLAEEEQHPVGCLKAEFRQRDENWCLVAHQACYLGGIVVLPEFRRRGIARALLVSLKREADARGIASIELDVWAFNGQAREAFVRLGFTRLMERMTLSTEGRTRRSCQPWSWLIFDVSQKSCPLTCRLAKLASAHDRDSHSRNQATAFEAFGCGSPHGFRVSAAIEARVACGTSGSNADDERDGRWKESQTEGLGEAAWSCLIPLATSQFSRARRLHFLSACRGRSRSRYCDCFFSSQSIPDSSAITPCEKRMGERFSISWSATGISVSGQITQFANCASQKSTSSERANQALEPTSPSVTDRADARSAPAGVVAHL